MDHEFWHDKWNKNEIGFHQPEINPHLLAHFPDLGLPPGSRVLVPLCGKSKDMCWLADQGYKVVGIELSETAARQFFEEQQLPLVSEQRSGDHLILAADQITIICGDFFKVTPDLLGPVDGAYDRAALIAMPPELRTRYAEQLRRLSRDQAPQLLVTMEYPQEHMAGPPFSVETGEVESLYGDDFLLSQVDSLDLMTTAEGTRWQQRGLSYVQEKVYLVTPR